MIQVNADATYNVYVEEGAVRRLAPFAAQYDKVAIVTDDKVWRLFPDALKLSGAPVFVMKNGEKSKNLATLGELLSFFARNGLTRADAVAAFGGGVVGDTAGFAAAVYMRGIDYIQIPTTLLAMLDSSVGGKTAVDLPEGKNLAGAFRQPSAVFCDVSFLKTLPEKEFKNGLGEALKCGAIKDAGLFDRLARGNFDGDAIERCVSIKADIAGRDPFDRGERALLNFGHTLGHAVERHSDYKIGHGAAVGIGMYALTAATEKLGLSENGTAARIKGALEKNGMEYEYPLKQSELLKLALNDKKREGDVISLVICKKIGDASIQKFGYRDLIEKLKSAGM